MNGSDLKGLSAQTSIGFAPSTRNLRTLKTMRIRKKKEAGRKTKKRKKHKIEDKGKSKTKESEETTHLK